MNRPADEDERNACPWLLCSGRARSGRLRRTESVIGIYIRRGLEVDTVTSNVCSNVKRLSDQSESSNPVRPDYKL